jgi:hypothetical protein
MCQRRRPERKPNRPEWVGNSRCRLRAARGSVKIPDTEYKQTVKDCNGSLSAIGGYVSAGRGVSFLDSPAAGSAKDRYRP